MIDSVAGGMMLAIPAPWMKNVRSRNQIGVVSEMKMNATSDSVTSASPVVATALAPNRLTIAALRGAKTIWATANGTNSAPEASGP